MPTNILQCTCQHQFQDKVYGHGKRVHNQMKVEGTKPPQYRCTVCSNVK